MRELFTRLLAAIGWGPADQTCDCGEPDCRCSPYDDYTGEGPEVW
jgi:hypothetical protein